MKIILLTVGKTTNPHLIKLQEEYQNRLKFYIPFELIVIPELKNTKNLSIKEQLEKEADFVVLDFAGATPFINRRLKNAKTLEEKLFILMILADERSVLATYIAGIAQYLRAKI